MVRVLEAFCFPMYTAETLLTRRFCGIHYVKWHDKEVLVSSEEMSFTVTYAMYDETPIACQGNDDRSKIQVIKDRVDSRAEIHSEALKRSVAMSKAHGKHVQVWDVQKRDKEC